MYIDFFIYICIYSFEVFRKPSYIQPGISHATSPSLVLTSSAHRKSVLGLESRRRPELQWTCQRCDVREQQDLGQTGWNWSNCLERWLNFLKGELGFFFSDTDTPYHERCKRSRHAACAGVSFCPFVLIKGFIGGEWVNNTAEPGVGVARASGPDGNAV